MMPTARSMRHAARRLLRAPTFTIAAVVTLALGIGATAAVFGVVDGVLLRPLPYDNPSRLVDLSHTLVISGMSTVDQSDASYLYYRGSNHVFTDMGAYQSRAVNLGPVSGAGSDAGAATEPERTEAGRVSASVFTVLGAPPLHGRAFTENDNLPGAAPVVLVGERLWKRRYGGDPGLIGRRLMIDGTEREVVGIMPTSFRFPANDTELWLPIPLDPANTASASFDYKVVARLRDGVSPELAAADLQRLLPRLPEAFPGRLTASAIQQIHLRAVVTPMKDVVVGGVGRVLWVVLGAVGLVLLIACANVANLFLVRAEGRQKELAVRRALGAGPSAIAMELLSECILIAGLGGMIGIALAAAGLRVLRSLGGLDIPRLATVGLDGQVLAFAVGVTVLAAFLSGALPAVRRGSSALSLVLGESGRTATVGRGGRHVRNVLVVSQVALALVLLVASGLMARSFARLHEVDPGFEPSHVLTARFALPNSVYPTSGDAARFVSRALDEIAAIPGIRAAGVVSKLPLDDEGKRDSAVFVEDRPLVPGSMPNIHDVAYVSPDYFRAMGIQLVAGRSFERIDPAHAPLEVLVSRDLAQRYWKGESALGKRVRMRLTGPWYTVVGVVGSVHGTALEQPPEETIYSPIVSDAGETSWTPRQLAIVVRAAGDPAAVAAPVRNAIHSLDPALPVYRVTPMDELLSRASARTSLTLLLLGTASVMAMVLGAVGIYGVIAYMVSLRTREIGVRLALGAQPAAVSRMVAVQGITAAATGIAVGLVGAAVVTRVLAALLFQVSATDPVAFVGAAALLFVVALLASWLPARRAASVAPAEVLRRE